MTRGYSENVGTRQYLFAGLIVSLVLVVVVVAVTPFGAPRAAPPTTPADQFSSARAMDHLRVIAGRSRPIGSAGDAAAAEHIRRHLESLGLNTHTQVAEVVSPIDPRVAGRVHNVVGRLPGTDPSRAVLLMTHYDSVPTSVGAADDGSGVAALLETARALCSGPPPRNDVIFLFTDGEEQGLLGARAFLRDDPWAYAVGVAFDFDSPGSSSPALMYETSPGNGLLVREYAAATDPFSSSLMYEVSRRQRIVGDFQLFLARGVPGMSFGMLDGPGYYHTAYDSLASLDEDALQHEGETALSLARRFGALDLWHVRRPDVVYFDLLGDVAVVYAQSLVLPFATLAVVLFAAAVGVAAGRRLLSLRGLALATLGTGMTLAASLLVTAVSWWMYQTAYQERSWTRTGVVISDWYRVGLVLLAAAVVLAIYGFLLRRLRAWDLAVAGMAWWAAGTVGVSLFFPGASFLLTWSLAGGSLGLVGAALVDRPSGDRPAAALIALAGAVPGLALVSSAVYLLLMSAGLKQGVTVLAVWLLAGLLMLPLAVVERALRIWPPIVLAVLGGIVLFAVGSTVAFDAEHPKFTSVAYRVQSDGTPVWQAIGRLDDYTRAYVRPRPGDSPRQTYFPDLGVRDTLVGPAPSYGLTAPRLSVLSDVTEGDRRTVRVRLRPTRDAAVVSLLVHTVVGTLTASVDGHELGGRDTTLLDGTTVRWWFDFHAPPPEGIVVTLDFAAGPRVLLRAVDCAYGLPAGAAGAYPARPAGMLPGGIGDVSLTETELRLPRAATAPD